MQDDSPEVLRQVYFDAWQKAKQNQPLTPMDAVIVDIIERHPEYHPIFEDEQSFNNLHQTKFALDHNPFLHLGLHVAIIEQAQTDRPQGVKAVYQRLLAQHQDKTVVEHKMISCLMAVLAKIAETEQPFDEQAYVAELNRLR